MMRPFALPLVLLVALAAPGAAQEGCAEDAPCPWAVDVDGDGFLEGVEDLEATQGDWIMLSILNFDDEAHTLMLEGYGLEWTVEGLDEVETEAFQLVESGAFRLLGPSGDHVTLAVFVTSPEEGITDADERGGAGPTPGDGRGTPAAAAAFLVAVLGAAALVRRR